MEVQAIDDKDIPRGTIRWQCSQQRWQMVNALCAFWQIDFTVCVCFSLPVNNCISMCGCVVKWDRTDSLRSIKVLADSLEIITRKHLHYHLSHCKSSIIITEGWQLLFYLWNISPCCDGYKKLQHCAWLTCNWGGSGLHSNLYIVSVNIDIAGRTFYFNVFSSVVWTSIK